MGTESVNWHLILDCDLWVALLVAVQQPSTRYKVPSYLSHTIILNSLFLSFHVPCYTITCV